MISDNPNSVAATQAVLAFFDFVQNPEKFKGIISDLRSVNDERKKIVGLYASVEDFNRKAEDARIAFNRQREEWKAERERQIKELEKQKGDLKERETKLAEQSRRIQNLSSQTAQKASELAAREAALAEAKRGLAAERQSFDVQMAELTKRDAESVILRRKLDDALKAV